MRRLSLVAIGFIFGILLSNWGGTARAQESSHSAAITIPPIEFTLKDVITVLGEYSLMHSDIPVADSGVYGRTSHAKRMIYVFRSESFSQRATVVHELLHILYHQRGVSPNDERILQEETAIMLELYGLPGLQFKDLQ